MTSLEITGCHKRRYSNSSASMHPYLFPKCCSAIEPQSLLMKDFQEVVGLSVGL